MDLALLLFLALLGGYWFSERFHLTSYKSAREHGHRLHYRAATHAILLIVLASLLRIFLSVFPAYVSLEESIHMYLAPYLNETGKIDRVPLLVISFYALILGGYLPYLLNKMDPTMKDKALKDALDENEFEKLVHTAGQKVMPLCLTTDKNKVYVGYVVKTPNPKVERKTIGILPVMSGYVANDKQFVFTTFYQPIYDELKNNPDKYQVKRPADFEKIVPVSSIQSVNMFDIYMYYHFVSLANNSSTG